VHCAMVPDRLALTLFCRTKPKTSETRQPDPGTYIVLRCTNTTLSVFSSVEVPPSNTRHGLRLFDLFGFCSSSSHGLRMTSYVSRT
jgi:hypothetical protein